MRFDLAIWNAIHRFWGKYRFLDGVGLFLANALTYFLAAGMLVFVFRVAHSYKERLFVLGEMLLALLLARGILTSVISAIVGRARPFETLGFTPPFVPLTDGAFPSGHMAGLFAIAFVMFTFDTRWGIAYFALSLLVGLARVFTGIHWPSDILGGIAVGLLSGWAVHFLTGPARRELFGAKTDRLTEPSSAAEV